MVTATFVVLAVLLLAVFVLVALFGVAALQRQRAGRRTGRRTGRRAGTVAARPRPALGSPAQVWLERGERGAARLRELGVEHPSLVGVHDDADAVVAELRAAAAQVAALDQARSGVPAPTLRAQRRRLDAAIAGASGTATEPDLRAARDSVDVRLATVVKQQAAREALLVRMRAAVTGLEAAHAELTALLAGPTGSTGSSGAAATTAATGATAALADRLVGLRTGLAEVRALGTLDVNPTVDPAQAADQGPPGDLPGSVEPPTRT